MKKTQTKYLIEITKESGEVVLTMNFPSELSAHNHFEEMEKIKCPMTYKGYRMNLSEWPENRIGSVRVVVEKENGRFERRELYRKP